MNQDLPVIHNIQDMYLLIQDLNNNYTIKTFGSELVIKENLPYDEALSLVNSLVLDYLNTNDEDMEAIKDKPIREFFN
jgi:hypothetical protein